MTRSVSPESYVEADEWTDHLCHHSKIKDNKLIVFVSLVSTRIIRAEVVGVRSYEMHASECIIYILWTEYVSLSVNASDLYFRSTWFNLGWNTGYAVMFFTNFSLLSGRCWDITLNWAMTASSYTLCCLFIYSYLNI